MATQFGDKIRLIRINQKMLLRHVASALDIDTALLSKIERGSRVIKKEQIPLIAEVLKTDKEELITLWLADQVMNVLKDEKMADEALKTVSKNIKKKN
ncbi:helix-turn-helix transcriptional regulator [Chitinophaga sp. Mgbs1]|uniref:Helix-turn-helix transcriptional regulator n=1 Tax=Chitinophaga solisilvae TaxID=1233460 RepID=A0A433WB16_9BACT|nr:helix-turn-helix transcriptional regulator [Chitinophaga solisilvae]